MKRSELEKAFGHVDASHTWAVIEETENGLMVWGSGLTAVGAMHAAQESASTAGVSRELAAKMSTHLIRIE